MPIVMFADLLGFASLTETHDASVDDFEVLDRPETNEFLTATLQYEEASPLVDTFVRFHVALHEAISDARSGASVTAVTFSDSAFVVTDEFHTASGLATNLMNKLLPREIMLRIGIAEGSFVPIRFRADVGIRSGDHSAQFVGTGVVRAYTTAEKAGIRGARILLHPSIPPEPGLLRQIRAFDRPLYWQRLAIGEDEANNRVGIREEVNYIGRKDRKLYRGVHRAQLKAPREAQSQYFATYRAMNRMRAQVHRPPLPDDLSTIPDVDE